MPAIMGDGRKGQAGRAVGVGFVHGQEKLRRFVKPSIPAAKVEPPFTIWRLPSLAAGQEEEWERQTHSDDSQYEINLSVICFFIPAQSR
jgi:hypothetical protein